MKGWIRSAVSLIDSGESSAGRFIFLFIRIFRRKNPAASKTLFQARACGLFEWRKNPKGRLAEIIVLDQFSRNIYRGLPESFIADPQALTLAQEAVVGDHDELDHLEKAFLYMPFMHSESLLIQDQSVRLFENLGNQNNLDYAIKHREVIQRFGRFPHRNSILGRPSSVEETEFLKQPGSSF